MIVEQLMECRLAGGTEVLGGKNATAPLLSITKSHMTRPGLNPGLCGGKPATNRLSYGAARFVPIVVIYPAWPSRNFFNLFVVWFRMLLLSCSSFLMNNDPFYAFFFRNDWIDV
jgi:hypothetical protein